jgi:hypothetical protein
MVYNRIMKSIKNTVLRSYEKAGFVASALRFTLISALVFAALLPYIVNAYQAAPIAITRNATYITEKSARLSGEANMSEMEDALYWFEWGISGRQGEVYETPRYRGGGWSTLAPVIQEIYGLAPSTQYFFRLVVENGRGKDVGQTVYFTTKQIPNPTPQLAIAQTLEPLVIGDVSARLRGYVSPHGNVSTQYWFEWGDTQELLYVTPKHGKGGDASAVEVSVSNLVPGTPYFYRVVAENAAGVSRGSVRVFVTHGTPPPPPEAPRDQNITSPTSNANEIDRTTTTVLPTSGAQAGTFKGNNSGDTRYGLPGVSSDSYPGDIFGALFRKKSGSTQAPAGTAVATNGTQSGNTGTSGSGLADAEVAGAATSKGPFSAFWNTLTGKRGVEVTVEKIGPKKVTAHTPVEYKVSYLYRQSQRSESGKLKIILPEDVVYIGDNTGNELFVEAVGGGERTYILPTGVLEYGSTRTISILGMTTGDADGFPDARARLEYTDKSGVHVVAMDDAKTQVAATASSGGGILPSTFLGWILYVATIVALIIGVKKLRAYYLMRKDELQMEEDEEARLREDQKLLEELIPRTPQSA